MSITLVKGKPGSGKSYETVVYHIIPAIKDGRKVITNIPVNVEHFCLVFGEHVRDLIEVYDFDFVSDSESKGRRGPFLSEPSDYIKYQDWRNEEGQGCLFVIDECHFHFPLQGRGRGQSDLAQQQIEFFSGHRHWGFDFLFLTQSDRKLNKLIREDIEICIELRKNRGISDKSYRRFVYYYGEGKKGGLIEQDGRSYEDKYFSFYKSHTKSEGSITEASVKDLKRWYQMPVLYVPIIILIISVFSFFNTASSAADSLAGGELGDVEVKEKVVKNSPTRSGPKVNDIEDSNLPFADFDLRVSGFSDSSYYDNSGKWHLQHEVYFEADRKGYRMDLKLVDFYLAGYDVTVFSDCLVKISQGSFSRMLYCESKEAKIDKTVNPNPLT